MDERMRPCVVLSAWNCCEMSPLQWPTPTFASLALLLLSLGSFSNSASTRGNTASLLPRANARGIHGEDDISFAGRNIQNEDEGSVERASEAEVSDSREGRKRPYIPLNSLTFMTANSHVSTIDWSSTDSSQIRQYIAGSKLAGVPQTSTIRPTSQNKLTTSTLPPFPLIHKTTTKMSTPFTKNPFLLTTKRPTLPTAVRNVSTSSTRPSVLVNSRPITTLRTPTISTTIRPTASAVTSSTVSRMPTASTTRRLTSITGRPVELTTGPIKSITSPLITWKPSSLAISNTSAVTATSSIITWRPSSLANSNTYAITTEGTSDKPMTSATELTTIESTFFTQWFTNNGNSFTTGFTSTGEKTQATPTELPPPLDSIKPPLLSTWRPTLRPIPNYVEVTTQPPTTVSVSSSTTTQLPVNDLNPNASTENSPVLSLDNNYTTSTPAVQESYPPISRTSTALPIRNTPIPNYVKVTTEAPTTQLTSTTTQEPVNQVNPSAATEKSPILSWNNNFYSTSSPVVQESFSPTVRTTSSSPLLWITRWTSTISPQVVTSQPVQRPGNTGYIPAHQNRFISDSVDGQGIKPIKHATPPSEQQNYETEHEPLSHWQYLDSSPQPIDNYTTKPQLVVTNNFISDDDQKLIHEAFNRFQTQFSSATDTSTTWQEHIEDTDVPQIPTIEEPGTIGLAPQQPLWTTTQLLDDNKTSSVFQDDMVWYFDSSNEYNNPNVSWITNPRPQVPHNLPFTTEVTRDPITTPDPALFEIISGSSNEHPEKFPSNTDQSHFTASKPTHTTSKQDLFTIFDNRSQPTRASILRPLVNSEVQVNTHAELFKDSQPEVVSGSSLAAPPSTVDSNDDYDFDYAVYEDDLSEYYAAYGYLLGVEHEEDRQSKPDKLLTFDLDKNSPSILETLTWPYTTIPTKRPLDSDSAYSQVPAVENKNPINSHDTSETKYTSHLISSSNKENTSSVPPLGILKRESNFTTVSPIYTYSSLIPAYPQSQSLVSSIPFSLSENDYANFLTENDSIYPDYNDAYYYSYEDTAVVNDFQSSLQVDYSLKVGDSSVSRPIGSEHQENLNVNPLPHSNLPAFQVDNSKLEEIRLQANNNPHNLNVHNVGFLDTSYIPKIIKTTTTTRRPPVLYVPADRESQQSHNGSPTQDLDTFVALNPLKPTVAAVELESIQESKDTEISFSSSTSKPTPLLQDTSHNYVHYGHVSQITNLRPSSYKLTGDNMYHLFTSPFFVKEDKSNLSVYEPSIEKIKVESEYPPHELKNLHKQNSSSHLINTPTYNITPSNTNFFPTTYSGQSPETDATSSSGSQGYLSPSNVNLSLSNNFFHNNSSPNNNDTSLHAINATHNVRPFLLQPHSSYINPSSNFHQEPFTKNQTYVTSIKRIGLRPVTQKHGSQPPDSAPSLNNYQDKNHLSPVHSSNSDISQSNTASKKDHAITVTERHAQFTEVGSGSSSVLTVTDTTTFLPQLDDFSIKFAESGSNLGQSDGVDQHHQSSGSHFAHPSNHNNQQNHHPTVQVKIWKMVDGQLRLVEEQSVPSGMFHNSGLTNGAVVNPQDVPSDVLSMVATRMENPSLLYSLLNYTARKRRSLPSKPEDTGTAEADLGKTELKKNKSEINHRTTISINSENPMIIEKMQENRRPKGNSSTTRIKETSSRPAISPGRKNKGIPPYFVKTSRMNDESNHSDSPVIHLVIPNLKEQPSFNNLLQRLATQSEQTLINREFQTNNRESFPRNEAATGLAFARDQNNHRTPPHPISAFGGVGNNNLPFTPSPITFHNVPSEALLPQATKPEVIPQIKHFGGVGNRNHTNLPLDIGTSLDENDLGYLHVLSRLANQIQSSNVQNPSLQGILGDITRNSPGVQASGGVVGYSAAGTLFNSGASTQGNSFSQLLQDPSFPGEHRGSVLELLPSDLPHVNPLLPPDEPLDHPVPLSGVLGSLPSSSTLHREQLRKQLATITGTNTFSGHLGNEGFLNQNNHAVQNSVLGNQGQQSTFNQFTSDSQIPHPGSLASLVNPGPFDSPNLTPSLSSNVFTNARPSNSFLLPNQQNSQTAFLNQQSISPGYPQSGNQNLRLPDGSMSSPSQQMASPASYQQAIINRADVLSIIDRLQSQGSVPNGQSILDFSQTSAASSLPLQQPADLSPFDPSLPYLPYQDAPTFSDSPLISSLPGGTLNPSPATVTSSNVQGCTQSTLCSLGLASLVALGISNALALPFITPLFVGRRRRTLDIAGNFTGQGESHIMNDDFLRELLTMAVTAYPGFRDILTAAIAFHVDKAQQEKSTEDHIILNAKAKEYMQLLMSLRNDQITFLIQHALKAISGREQPKVDYNTPAQKKSSYIMSTLADSAGSTEMPHSK
ncbi:mucin-17-like [Penaeus chinensis]|uniref:mucin-17-like n=1 Tax=Penaeus chinensis TaxID=139456 RepID=UPI001FB6194B|nr:mucin-17-like [Penaeus chinensis]